MEKGFFASLFDISFTSFITTKIIKVLYVVALVAIGLVALVFVVTAFHRSAALGVVTLLIFAPLASLFYVIYARVGLELIIQIFRITELLRDQNQLQRTAFAGAGWLPATAPAPPVTTPPPPAPPAAAAPSPPAPPPAAAPPPPPTAQTAPEPCPKCGVVPSPGAAFCRNCGESLS